MASLDIRNVGISAHDTAQTLAAAAENLTDMMPRMNFGLVTMQRALELPPIAPMTIFAIGRCVGWIARAQEQYENPELIHPRARYIGKNPQPAHTT